MNDAQCTKFFLLSVGLIFNASMQLPGAYQTAHNPLGSCLFNRKRTYHPYHQTPTIYYTHNPARYYLPLDFSSCTLVLLLSPVSWIQFALLPF